MSVKGHAFVMLPGGVIVKPREGFEICLIEREIPRPLTDEEIRWMGRPTINGQQK